MALTRQEFARLARAGAQARLEELEREREAILRSFPGIGRPTPVETAAPKRRRRPKMTTAQRKAIGERMRKYWAERRKGKAKK